MSYAYNYQTQYAYSHYQEPGNDEGSPNRADTFYEDWSHYSPSTNFQPQQEERKSTLEDTLAALSQTQCQLTQLNAKMDRHLEKVEDQLRSLSGLPNQMNNLEFQIRQLASESYEEPSIEQDEEPREDEEEELNDEEREFCELLDELIEEFKEVDSIKPKDQETNENSPLSFFSSIYDNCLFDEKTNRILPFIVLDNDRSPLEANEEDPNKERKEDDEIIDEKEDEENPLMDLSNVDQQNQEEVNDELKSEMSISIPLTSSICTPLDIYASIDFILPLESFDYRKELKEILGVLKQGGRKLKKMLRNYVRKNNPNSTPQFLILTSRLSAITLSTQQPFARSDLHFSGVVPSVQSRLHFQFSPARPTVEAAFNRDAASLQPSRPAAPGRVQPSRSPSLHAAVTPVQPPFEQFYSFVRSRRPPSPPRSRRPPSSPSPTVCS
ncbi:hypothetical protein ACS0TY_033830 [Phlomoides rotata]